MRKSTGKLLIGLAVGILLAGGIGAIAYGSDGFTNPDINTWFDADWRAIEIKDQTKDYTGTKLEPDVVLPEGFTYEIVKIEKDGEEVSLETGAVQIGDYVFTLKVTKGEESRDYFCNLSVVEPENQLEEKIEAKNLNLKLLAVNIAEDGSITKEFTYTITPENATNQSINVSVAWAGDDSSTTDDNAFKSGKNVTDYVTISKEEAQKKITLTCSEAFGTQIIASITSVDNPNASASVKVEYRKRRTYSINQIAQTLSNSKLQQSELVEATFVDGIGTLPSLDPGATHWETGVVTINSSVSSIFDKYVELKESFNNVFNVVLSEVNKLSGASYNEVVETMNAHETDLLSMNISYKTSETILASSTITYGIDLGATSIKVEGIQVGDDSIEF